MIRRTIWKVIETIKIIPIHSCSWDYLDGKWWKISNDEIDSISTQKVCWGKKNIRNRFKLIWFYFTSINDPDSLMMKNSFKSKIRQMIQFFLINQCLVEKLKRYIEQLQLSMPKSYSMTLISNFLHILSFFLHATIRLTQY